MSLCYDRPFVNTWSLILVGLGLAMVLEGLPYFISPSMTKRYLVQVLTREDRTLRILGFGMMIGGLALIWLALH